MNLQNDYLLAAVLFLFKVIILMIQQHDAKVDSECQPNSETEKKS